MNRLAVSLAGTAAGLFYALEELGGAVPAEGPVILVGNHPNGLVDPVLVACRTDRVVRFLGKAPLFEMPVLGALMRRMEALPVYRAMDGADTERNQATFEAVFAALRAGDVICIFPEGRSHSEPRLQRLKTGAARMALGAEARADWRLGVRVVPVGLTYRRRGTYRSAAATWVGAPIEVGPFRTLHERDERACAEALTEKIAAGLRAVTIDLDAWEDLPLLREASRIWPREDAHEVERIQALVRGMHRLRREDPGRERALREMLRSWCERLDRLGIEGEDLAARPGRPAALRFVLRNSIALLVGVPLAALGAALWTVPYRGVHLVVLARDDQPDIVATVKLLASILFFPLWLGLLAGIAWAWQGWPLALALALLAPPLGTFAADFWPRRAEAFEDAQVFLRLARSPALRARLVRRRQELRAALEEAARALRTPPQEPDG